MKVFCITEHETTPITNEDIDNINRIISSKVGDVDDIEIDPDLNVPMVLSDKLKKASDKSVVCLFNNDIRYINSSIVLINNLSNSIDSSWNIVNRYYYDVKWYR